uniref:FAD dependent oxidoreductase domain-containing protein n=1 Tax=Glossina brevipalpis TaxID=37001 RepID=A0A1A9WAD5_9MUSC
MWRRANSKNIKVPLFNHVKSQYLNSIKEKSVINENLNKTSPPPIQLPHEADVVVIGGGSVGCHTLYHLVKRGVKAILLELANKQWELRYELVTYLDVVSQERRLRVGWERCRVYDGAEVVVCIKCRGFNHVAKDFKHAVTCYKCLDSHDPKGCHKEQIVKCINCIRANDQFKWGSIWETLR